MTVEHATDSDDSRSRLRDLTDRLLVRDADAHAAAVDHLADVGDERVVPHLLEVLVVDSIGRDWARFGFPTVLRDRDPPRYLELPEARWPGARDALAAIAEPDFDSPHAWVEWETWYSQQDIDPLAGFDDWKRRFYRSFLPPVGSLLDTEPRDFDLQDIRWGNCDRSFLAALNAPDFQHADAAPEDYLAADDVVFGLHVDGVAYAVPRWLLFPHELLNADLGETPVSLTYCTLCNAPICYDRRVGADANRDDDGNVDGDGSVEGDGNVDGDSNVDGDADIRTFGSTGMLLAGNKVMFDEETESLWDQHAGRPIAGPHLAADPDLRLDQHPVTQTAWADWVAANPATRVLDPDTGFDYEYQQYRGDVGFFEHYWNREEIVQPGVRREVGPLPEKASVYGVVADDATAVWVVPVDDLGHADVVSGTADGCEIVALRDRTGDVAVYAAPPVPVERSGDDVVDADGSRWTVERDALRAETGETRERVVGRHGLWFAFRTHYDEAHVLGEGPSE